MNRKITWVALGFTVTACILLFALFFLFSGFYFYTNFPADEESISAPEATSPPNAPATVVSDAMPTPTPTSPSTSNIENPDNPLQNLDHLSVLPFTYGDDEIEGVAIDIVFYNAHGEVITFTNTPIEITMEFYAFTDILNASDISQGDLVYVETVERDHSATLEEMFDNYIRIPYDKMNVDQDTYISFGAVLVIVETPNGIFEDTSILVTLYPDEE